MVKTLGVCVLAAVFAVAGCSRDTKQSRGNTGAGQAESAGQEEGRNVLQNKGSDTLVNVALGTEDASACADGLSPAATVDIAVIVQAVNNALNGCAAS